MSATDNWMTLAQIYHLAVEAFEGRATAELMLTHAMCAGTIAMRGEYFFNGKFYPDIKLTKDFLSEKGNIIWQESRIEQRLTRIDPRGESPNYLLLGNFHRIKINRADVEKLWPEMVSQTAPEPNLPAASKLEAVQVRSAPSTHRPRAGGRPTKYDWEGALIEMARIAILEEDSDRPALVRAVQNWFAQKGQEPAESLIREKVKRFHETIWPLSKT